MNAPVSLIRSPWGETFTHLLRGVRENLLLASPFVKRPQSSEVSKRLEERGLHRDVKVTLITDIRPECALSGSTDLEAIVELARKLPLFALSHLPSLHAKVYIADDRMAVVTSANLTNQGVKRNVEYGVAFTHSEYVQEIRADFEAFARLGAAISIAEIESLAEELLELRAAFERAERSIRSQARRIFQERFKAAQTRVLAQRAKGRTTSAILAETILFLLSKGPLATTELHPLIQSLHPDICDDSIDRVIDGVHFGKKWKHHVRSAQQLLKSQSRIRYQAGLWHLAPSAERYV